MKVALGEGKACNFLRAPFINCTGRRRWKKESEIKAEGVVRTRSAKVKRQVITESVGGNASAIDFLLLFGEQKGFLKSKK